ncbi:MAG: tRNA (adenosine(37)-N6)-dimethylallyltransferase MiaA [Marinilabiliales bacterium]
MKPYNLICILGHTAGGKTSLAAHLAYKIKSEIISADSRQIYRNMSIGTGKDLEDYIVNGEKINYHLIDIKEAGTKYNVYEFQKDFLKVFNQLSEKNIIPILCGGTGLYIEAVTKGYKLIHVPVNPELRKKLENYTLEQLTVMLSKYKKLHNKTDVDTKKRAIRAIEIETYYKNHPEIKNDYPEINCLYIGVKFSREERRERITKRLHERLKNGMIEEVQKLLKEGLNPDDLIYYGLEYKYITEYLTGKYPYNEMVSKLETAIHQFAKRQMTWFRGMERKGTKIHWLDGNLDMDKKIEKILNLLDK